MFLSSTLSDNLSILDAGIIALLGYAVVFFGLILLQIVIMAMGRYFISRGAKVTATGKEKRSRTYSPAPVIPVTPAATPAAPGTSGEPKLYDTPPETAAMIMAIIANKLGKPLNELQFESIREVK